MYVLWVASDFSPAESDSEALAVSTARAGEVAVVTLSGEIDVRTVEQLREALGLGTVQAPGPEIVLDLSGVSFLGSSGLAALVEGASTLRNRGGWLRVVTGNQRVVVRALEVTGLAGVFPTHSSVADALSGDDA
jgi:anti-sigma B factor antagonist